MSEIDRERHAARAASLVQPRPDLGTLVVTGGDRQAWLNGLVTCDLTPLRAGQGAYGLCVGKTGRILTELWIVVAAEHLAIAVPAERAERLREHLDRHLIMEDAELRERSAEHAWVFAHGPLSKGLLALVAAEPATAATAMIDWTGRGDAGVLLARREGVADAERALLGHAGEAGALSSAQGWEQLRVEWGLPRFGVDFDDQTLPQEASLERLAVSFTKGCYLGQETIFMLEKRGHAKKRLVRLAVAGREPVPSGAPIALEDGTVVGAVSSVAPEPAAGEGLALGYVKYKHAVADATISIAGRAARVLGLAGGPAASA